MHQARSCLLAHWAKRFNSFSGKVAAATHSNVSLGYQQALSASQVLLTTQKRGFDLGEVGKEAVRQIDVYGWNKNTG